MPDSVAVKALTIALVLAGAASAQTSTRTIQLRFVSVERALEAVRAAGGAVVATGDRRTSRLVLSGPVADVGKASERATRADLPAPPQVVTVVIGQGRADAPVWAGIASVEPGRATSLSVETPQGVASALGATAVRVRLWLEGQPDKSLLRAEVQVKTAAGPVDLAGKAELVPDKPVRIAAADPLTLDVTLLRPVPRKEPGR